jgi:DNA polymerase I
MVRVHRSFWRSRAAARIIMMIHDALWVEAPEKEADEVRHLMRRMMSTAAKLRVPLVAEIK